MHTLEISESPNRVTIAQVRTPDLGDHSYVVAVDDAAAAIDPQRDIERMNEAIGGARLLGVFETHIHNDYVTGGHLLAGSHGAAYILPAGTGASLDHREISDGERFEIGGGWAMEAIHTPGHTLNHTSYALVGPSGVAAVFSGGSMLVGAVGRSDLLGPDLTEKLARYQFRSVNRLATEMPDPALVAPTHGAGSFCSASAVADTTSTIELEKRRNPALTERDEDTFVRTQIAGYRLHPTYYRHMGPTNLNGIEAIRTEPLLEVAVDSMDGLDAELVDLRPATEWAAGHLRGSVNVPARDDFAQYVGWVLPWNRAIVLVGAASQIDQARLQLARIGYDNVVGVITSGPDAWRAAGCDLATARTATFADLAASASPVVVDVRDPLEYAEAHLEGAVGTHVSRIPQAEPFGVGDVWLYCATGYRASIAAGFVERSGASPIIVLDNWDEHGRPLASQGLVQAS